MRGVLLLLLSDWIELRLPVISGPPKPLLALLFVFVLVDCSAPDYFVRYCISFPLYSAFFAWFVCRFSMSLVLLSS